MVLVREAVLLLTVQRIIDCIDIEHHLPGHHVVCLQERRYNQPIDGILRCTAPVHVDAAGGAPAPFVTSSGPLRRLC